MTNPYAQVARTYVGQLVFQVIFAALLVAVAAVLLLSGDMGFRAWPVMPLGLALYVISIFVTQHAVNQFSNPRARLLPGFSGPQLAVPGLLALLACGLVWQTLVFKGTATSLGAAAFVLAVFVVPAWLIYWRNWQNLVAFLVLWVLLLADSGQKAISMLNGEQPVAAWVILALSTAAIAWMGVRLTRLNDRISEFPNDQSLFTGDSWQPMTSQDLRWLKSPPWFVRPFVNWNTRYVDRVLALGKPGASPCLRLWQLPMAKPWAAWVLGAFLGFEYVFPRLIGRSPGPLIVFVTGSILISLMPIYTAFVRQPILGYESLRPLARGEFLRTIALAIFTEACPLMVVMFVEGVAAALLEFPSYFQSPQFWAIMVLAMVTPAMPFACTLWPGWRRNWLWIGLLGLVPAFIGDSVAFGLVLNGTVYPVGGFLLAGTMVLIAGVIAWLAYRRGLVADFD